MEEDTTRPHRAVRAILPNWEAWRDRGEIPLTFRMTQVLTGHGVFGEYLLKIQREVTCICHHCQEEEDTAQHTLERCPAWEEPRRVIRLTIGDKLALEAVIEAMTRRTEERQRREVTPLEWLAEENRYDAARPWHHHYRRHRRARRRSRQTEEGLPPPSDSHDGPGNAALVAGVVPPLAAKLNQDASHNNEGRRRRMSVAEVYEMKGTGTFLTSVMTTTVGFNR
jgi:hypothetical protein